LSSSKKLRPVHLRLHDQQNQKNNSLKKKQWSLVATSITLATQEAEIRRIEVRSQPR
jgi:hypothetical protein